VTGDLTTALATIPGVTFIPSATGGIPTVSAFGYRRANSPSSMGLDLARASARWVQRRRRDVDVHPQGGIAGIQTSLRMQGGNNLLNQSIHTTFDAPSLQWTTPIASQLSSGTPAVVSGTLSGPIVPITFSMVGISVPARASG